MKSTRNKDLLRALLVSIKTQKVSDLEAAESLAELERLVTTLGFKVVARESQRKASSSGATVVGEGKLKELALYTGGPGVLDRASFATKSKAALKREAEAEGEDEGDDDPEELESEEAELDLNPEGEDAEERPSADVVIFDCDLTPSQLRNVENALGVEVLDRSGVIIEIFSRHARTRAASLQVEIARLNYLAPRLREAGGATERQAGRGSGESELELDRRKIRDRITELKHELTGVQREQAGRRTIRSDQPCVALVGYTNAGKSSTMRALTGSEVLVQDKLFATLDTTVRALQPETQPRVLISDTVGFIKKLPHDLVASFKSTLDEALNASLLLYLVDASDPTFRSQLEVTQHTLREVGVEADSPHFLVLNKADRLGDDERRRLTQEFPGAILMSAHSSADVKALRERILNFFERDMVEEKILARYDTPGIVGEVRARMRVVREDFGAEGVTLTVRTRPTEVERLKKKFHLP